MIHMGPSTTRRIIGPSPSAVLSAPPQPPMSPARRSVGRLVIPLVFVFLVVSAGVVIYQSVSPLVRRIRKYPRTCTNPSCNYFSIMLSDSMNLSVDPCHNFYKFVCDRWISTRLEDVRQTVKLAFFKDLDLQMGKTYTPFRGQTAVQKTAAFFQSCKAFMHGKNGLPELKKVLRSIGVFWPHRSPKPDVLNTLMTLSMEWDWSTLLEFRKHHVTGTSYWFEIAYAPSFETLVKRRALSLLFARYAAYFEMLHISFRNDDNTPTVTYAEMSSLEFKVLLSLKEAYGGLPKDVVKWTVVEHLGNAAISKERWREQLEAHGRVPVDDELSIAIRNPAFFEQIFNLTHSLGEQQMEMFIGWNAVQHVVFFTNKDIIDNYLQDVTDDSEGAKQDFCTCLTQTYMGAAMYSSYFDKYVVGDIYQDVRHVVNNVRQYFFHRVSQVQWYNRSPSFLSDWDLTGSSLWYYDTASNASLDDAYSSYPNMGEHLLSNYRKALDGYRASSDRFISAMKCATIDAGRPYEIFDYRIDFILAPYVIVAPFYDYRTPSGVKFGGLGTQVARAAADVLWTYEHARYSRPSPSLIAKANCFLTLASDSGTEGLYRWMSLNALWEAFRSAAGTDDATLLYQRQFSESQLFFVITCYPECSGKKKSEEICNGPLRHSPQFAETFQCPEGSPMNPAFKCTIF